MKSITNANSTNGLKYFFLPTTDSTSMGYAPLVDEQNMNINKK